MKKQLRWIVVLIMVLALTALACGAFGGGEEPTAEPAEETVTTTEEESTGEDSSETPAEEDAAEEATAMPTATPQEAAAEEPESESSGETAASTEESSTETVESTPESSESESSESEASEPLESIELADIDQDLNFDSYSFDLEMTFTTTDEAGDETTQSVNAEVQYVADPFATSIKMSVEGIEGAEEFGQMEMAQIDGVSYMSLPEFGCISSSGEEDMFENPFDEMLSPDELLEELSEARRVGEETVSGIPSIHYTFDEESLDSTDEVEWVEGHVYIAKEGGYVVSLVMDGEGDLNTFADGSDQFGKLHMEYNIKNVNEPVEIALPEGCDSANLSDSAYPILEDAYEFSSFAGFVSYKSDVSFEEAVEFYEEALAEEDWTKDEGSSFITEGNAIMSFTKEGETLNLIISEESDSGALSITISTEGEE